LNIFLKSNVKIFQFLHHSNIDHQFVGGITGRKNVIELTNDILSGKDLDIDFCDYLNDPMESTKPSMELHDHIEKCLKL
jgi:hypothetical protein